MHVLQTTEICSTSQGNPALTWHGSVQDRSVGWRRAECQVSIIRISRQKPRSGHRVGLEEIKKLHVYLSAARFLRVHQGRSHRAGTVDQIVLLASFCPVRPQVRAPGHPRRPHRALGKVVVQLGIARDLAGNGTPHRKRHSQMRAVRDSEAWPHSLHRCGFEKQAICTEICRAGCAESL
jgi:hypothetical protein